MIKYIIAVVAAALAVAINFKAKFIATRILKREPSQDLILKIKLVAAALCIADFAFVMIFI